MKNYKSYTKQQDYLDWPSAAGFTWTGEWGNSIRLLALILFLNS